jgi:flagellar biosynthesis protein FliR
VFPLEGIFGAKLFLFTLVLARVAGLTLTAPIFGTSDVPLRVRAIIAAALAVLVVPSQWSDALPLPSSAVNCVALLGCEAAIGACLGLGILVLIHAMTLAGEVIGQASGLGIAEVFDPALGQDVPVFSRLMFLVGVAVFLCIGGHRLAMAGLLDTFRAFPPGGGLFPESATKTLIALVGQSFSLGVRAAAPAVTALLLATIVLGLVARTLPQVNILTIGLGANALLAFAALSLSLGTVVWAYQDQIQPALNTVFSAFQTPMRAS